MWRFAPRPDRVHSTLGRTASDSVFALAFRRYRRRMTESFSPVAVRVLPGVIDATLGDVGVAVGVARRAFAVGDVELVDIDLSVQPVEQFPSERRSSFYEQKIVFTRLRLPRICVKPNDPSQWSPVDF